MFLLPLLLLAVSTPQDAWEAYSKCEKTDANKASYTPLSKGSDDCKSIQASGAC